MNTGSSPIDLPFDEQENRERIAALRRAGVVVWSAERVFVGAEVPIASIEPEAILMNAVIRGRDTIIGGRSKIGTSGMAVITHSQIGRGVELGAGSYYGTTLFHNVKARGFAEFRSGTVLEEEAETGHNVGLKHTFFTAGVVAGSCINFCDVLVTGGSSREDHSEIGSGAMHFNFDPRRDKFGSLFGDARGLLLRKKPVFVGGNSGVIAPVQIGFGAIIPAGVSIRRDLAENEIYSGETVAAVTGREKIFDPGIYSDLKRKTLNTASLCGNLQALDTWYRTVRVPCSVGLDRALCESAIRNIRLHIDHRANEFNKVMTNLSRLAGSSLRVPNAFHRQHIRITEKREGILRLLLHARRLPADCPEPFFREYKSARETAIHCEAIQGLRASSLTLAEDWLARIAIQPRLQLAGLVEL